MYHDFVFSTFASEHLKSMTFDELKEYDTILPDHGNEWDMFAWAARTKVPTMAVQWFVAKLVSGAARVSPRFQGDGEAAGVHTEQDQGTAADHAGPRQEIGCLLFPRLNTLSRIATLFSLKMVGSQSGDCMKEASLQLTSAHTPPARPVTAVA